MTANFKIDSMTRSSAHRPASEVDQAEKNQTSHFLQTFLVENPTAKALTEATACSITAQTNQGRNYIVITSGNTNTQIEATNGTALNLFRALKAPRDASAAPPTADPSHAAAAPRHTAAPPTAASSHASADPSHAAAAPRHTAAPPTAASSHAAAAPRHTAVEPAKNTTLLELENSILRKKQTLTSQKGLLSMVGSYLPSFSKPTPDKLTIELYKELFTYYKLKGTELSNPPPTGKAQSFEDQPLYEMLSNLSSINSHLAPLEYFEVLNFIDDARHSQGLMINKAVIEAKIGKLATTIKSREASREHELNLELNKSLPQGTTQESLASMIRTQQQLLKTDDANRLNPCSCDTLFLQEREAEETKLQALLFKYYNYIMKNLTTPTSDTPMELHQRNLLLNSLKEIRNHSGLHLAKVDYCTIFNKIDQAMASGKLITDNPKLVAAIEKDIKQLKAKLAGLAKSAEGDLTLFMQGVVQ